MWANIIYKYGQSIITLFLLHPIYSSSIIHYFRTRHTILQVHPLFILQPPNQNKNKTECKKQTSHSSIYTLQCQIKHQLPGHNTLGKYTLTNEGPDQEPTIHNIKSKLKVLFFVSGIRLAKNQQKHFTLVWQPCQLYNLMDFIFHH